MRTLVVNKLVNLQKYHWDKTTRDISEPEYRGRLSKMSDEEVFQEFMRVIGNYHAIKTRDKDKKAKQENNKRKKEQQSTQRPKLQERLIDKSEHGTIYKLGEGGYRVDLNDGSQKNTDHLFEARKLIGKDQPAKTSNI